MLLAANKQIEIKKDKQTNATENINDIFIDVISSSLSNIYRICLSSFFSYAVPITQKKLAHYLSKQPIPQRKELVTLVLLALLPPADDWCIFLECLI